MKAADFRHTASFEAGRGHAWPFVRWTMPSPSPARVRRMQDLRRPPSSLYTFPRIARAMSGLGSALPRRAARQGFHRI